MELKAFSSIVSLFLMLTTCINNNKEPQKTTKKTVTQKEAVKIIKDSTAISEKEALKDKSSKTYIIPKALDINVYITKKCQGTFDCRIEPFYPIGWSTDGNFAFITEPDTEAAGAYVFHIYVKNNKNKILWKWEFSQLDQENWEDDDINTIWKRNQKLFNQKLNAYGIIQDTTITIRKLPYLLDKKTYMTSLKQSTHKNELFGIDEISKIDISFHAKSEAQKIIYSQKFKKNEMVIYTEIVGIIISPNLNTFALLNTNTQRGWEGPPHIIAVQAILGEFN